MSEAAITVSEAAAQYLDDCRRRGLAKSTINGKRGTMKLFRDALGDRPLRLLVRADYRAMLASWTGSGSTRITRQRHLGAMLAFCVAEGWIDRNPIKGIQAPKNDSQPTQPLSRGEMRALLDAAAPGSPERALLLLMRYSGMAIGDASIASPEAVRKGSVVIRRIKTGSLCVVPLPEPVLAALDNLPVRAGGHWFWTGRSEPVTAAKTWRNRLKRVAEKAGVEGFRPHRLRNTFAVELLLDGVQMEDVSRLLGHRSIAITESHYAPWCRARLDRLESVVRDSHSRDRLLLEGI